MTVVVAVLTTGSVAWVTVVVVALTTGSVAWATGPTVPLTTGSVAWVTVPTVPLTTGSVAWSTAMVALLTTGSASLVEGLGRPVGHWIKQRGRDVVHHLARGAARPADHGIDDLVRAGRRVRDGLDGRGDRVGRGRHGLNA